MISPKSSYENKNDINTNMMLYHSDKSVSSSTEFKVMENNQEYKKIV